MFTATCEVNQAIRISHKFTLHSIDIIAMCGRVISLFFILPVLVVWYT